MMGLVTATAVLTYLDRLNLGITGKFIQDEFSIPLKTMGWILGAFLLGYSLSQVPGGCLSDRFGPRKVLDCGGSLGGRVPHSHRPRSSALSDRLVRRRLVAGEEREFLRVDAMILIGAVGNLFRLVSGNQDSLIPSENSLFVLLVPHREIQQNE
jgi:MFS family permease